jgi:hypothetical protein
MTVRTKYVALGYVRRRQRAMSDELHGVTAESVRGKGISENIAVYYVPAVHGRVTRFPWT